MRYTAPPAPLPDGEARTPADTGLPAGIGERLGATYACRHLRPDDWRYAYCVTAWNDYKRRVGLP